MRGLFMEINNMTIESMIAIFAAIFGSTGFWSFVQAKLKDKSNEGRLLMGIAYAKIVQTAQAYIDRGYLSAEEYHELHHYLYEPYKAMGGNGTAAKLIDEVSKLPTKKEESDDV